MESYRVVYALDGWYDKAVELIEQYKDRLPKAEPDFNAARPDAEEIC